MQLLKLLRTLVVTSFEDKGISKSKYEMKEKCLLGDLTIRLWNIETNDNFTLPTLLENADNDVKLNNVSEMYICVTYCKINQTLCAGK